MVNQSKDIIAQSESAVALMNTIIDYAGIFPPTELPLERAITNYAEYVRGNDSWMIGPFVFPVARFKELEQYLHLFTLNHPLSISAIIRKADNEEEMLYLLKKDLTDIQIFRDKHGASVQIQFLELPLCSLSVSQDTLNQVTKLAKEYDVTCYCEVPVHNEVTSEQLIQVAQIFAHANNATNQLRAKLRTGSVKKELIPSVKTVASFIYACKEHNVSMKFTAGLHHPIREFRKEVDGIMHGYLNVFTAGLMAYYHNLSEAKIIEILSDENHTNFSLRNDHLSWNNLQIGSEDMQQLRSYVCTFGSCNFMGPLTELAELKIIEGGK